MKTLRRHLFATLLWFATLETDAASPSSPAHSRFVLVSDVDDTIKDTGVTLGRSHLKNFPRLLLDPVLPWRPVPGMAPLFQALEKKTHARVFYVSKGPPLSRSRLERELIHHHFPPGAISLNDAFPIAPRDYKFRVISTILARLPAGHYLLVGDSGELDPENYGMLARRFPQRIDHIWIRSVTADGEGRYRRAFRGVPRDKWEVFTSPDDLRIGWESFTGSHPVLSTHQVGRLWKRNDRSSFPGSATLGQPFPAHGS